MEMLIGKPSIFRKASNLAYTFGGHWDTGYRFDIGSWKNNDAVAAAGFSVDPRRVPYVSSF